MAVDHQNNQDSIPFYPDHVRTEFWVAVGITVILFIIGAFAISVPMGIGEPADPLVTPEHTKPEWYFLALYQILKYVPKNVGAVAPVIALVLFTLVPFIDRKPDRSIKNQRIRMISIIIILAFLIFFTILGEVS